MAGKRYEEVALPVPATEITLQRPHAEGVFSSAWTCFVLVRSSRISSEVATATAEPAIPKKKRASSRRMPKRMTGIKEVYRAGNPGASRGSVGGANQRG